MLSDEIYGIWESKTKEDVRKYVRGPRIPSETRDANTFKAAVLEKIDKRRAESKRYRQTRIERIDESENLTCCSCYSKKKRKGPPIQECRTLASFERFCTASRTTFTAGIVTLRALIRTLSYWDSVQPGTVGLSVVGSYIWMMSYACQHLIDGPSTKEEFQMFYHLPDIKQKYEDLALIGEMFIDMTENFYESVYTMRIAALLTTKRLVKRWSIRPENNPLNVRPETLKKTTRLPRKRLGQGLDSPIDMDDDEDIFSVRWSPLTIYFQKSANDEKHKFSRLHPRDRITVFEKFLKHTYDVVEQSAEDLTVLLGNFARVEITTGMVMSATDITISLKDFSKSSNVPKSLTENQRRTVVPILNQYWYSLDVLFETADELMRLVQETRDAIRMCYVYTDVFYKWDMAPYDTFISKGRKRGGMRVSTSSHTHSKDFTLRLLPSDKKLSETVSIMMLMDFSNSIYQGVLHEIPITCEEMTLSLKTSEYEDEKSFGLVSGIVDIRKSEKGFKRPSY